MKIVSKFHDYYDTAAIYGIDKTCVYLRAGEIKKSDFNLDTGSRWRSWPHEEKFVKVKADVEIRYRVDKYVIGFCGNLHPVVVIQKETDGLTKVERFSFYSTEKVQAFFTKEKLKLESGRSYWSMRDFTVKSKQSLDNFFEVAQYKKLEEEFHKNNCPVFVYGRFEDNKKEKLRVVTNPSLRDYRFAQVKDPQGAFQDIFMYISGVLGISAPPMVKVKDKELAAKRGHDGKYSFRKPPGKRGKKQWR